MSYTTKNSNTPKKPYRLYEYEPQSFQVDSLRILFQGMQNFYKIDSFPRVNMLVPYAFTKSELRDWISQSNHPRRSQATLTEAIFDYLIARKYLSEREEAKGLFEFTVAFWQLLDSHQN